MVPAPCQATGTVPPRSARWMSPSQRSRTVGASWELLFNQLPLPQRTYSRDSHHHHRCPGAGTAGQEPAGGSDPSGELPGAARDAVSPPRRGLDEPHGLGGGGCGAEPWVLGRHLVRVEGGAPGPSAAELEEAVDLLQDVGEALVFGGAGGQGALRGGHSPVNDTSGVAGADGPAKAPSPPSPVEEAPSLLTFSLSR